MAKKPKIGDETLIEYIQQGLRDCDIAKNLGVSQPNLGRRLKELRKNNGAVPDTGSISYGKAKAAEYAREHAKVDVEGIMEGIRNPKPKSVEELFRAKENAEDFETAAQEPVVKAVTYERYHPAAETAPVSAIEAAASSIESRIMQRAKDDIDIYRDIRDRLIGSIEAGAELLEGDISAYGEIVARYGEAQNG